MATEHLILVNSQNKVKLAQRGQYDGQFTIAGAKICHFIWANLLHQHGFDLFQKRIDALQWASLGDIDDLWKHCHKDWTRFEAYYPEFCLATGADILDFIIDGRIEYVYDEREFKENSINCQYAYCIDLDRKLLHCWYETLEPIASIPFVDCTQKKMQELESQIIVW